MTPQEFMEHAGEPSVRNWVDVIYTGNPKKSLRTWLDDKARAERGQFSVAQYEVPFDRPQNPAQDFLL